ncbi:MAG: zinc-ribbon domain-containing protein [Rhodospirillales bacterium]
MIITCQNCQTRYSVDAVLIGGGKTVCCENCGNSWQQLPQQAAPPTVYATPPPVAPQASLQQPFEPEPMPEPEADADAEMATMEAEGEAEAEAVEEDAGENAGAADDALSPDKLDEMFGEDTESEAFGELSGGGDKDETPDLSELENLSEPKPIPGVFTAADDDLDDGLEKKGKGKIIGIAVLVLLLALGGGAFFGRSMIIGLWPGAANIYAMVGLDGAELGDGLVIEDVKTSRHVDAGVDVLIIRGAISNVSEEDRMVPMIRVALFDANGDEVQFVDTAPLKNRLQAGTQVGFSAKLPEPSVLGRKVIVTFTEAKK